MLLLVTVSHRWHQPLHILRQLSGTDILLGKSLCKYASEWQMFENHSKNNMNFCAKNNQLKFWPVFGESEYLWLVCFMVVSYIEDEEGKGNWFMMLEKLDFITLMTILPDYCTL